MAGSFRSGASCRPGTQIDCRCMSAFMKSHLGELLPLQPARRFGNQAAAYDIQAGELVTWIELEACQCPRLQRNDGYFLDEIVAAVSAVAVARYAPLPSEETVNVRFDRLAEDGAGFIGALETVERLREFGMFVPPAPPDHVWFDRRCLDRRSVPFQPGRTQFAGTNRSKGRGESRRHEIVPVEKVRHINADRLEMPGRKIEDRGEVLALPIRACDADAKRASFKATPSGAVTDDDLVLAHARAFGDGRGEGHRSQIISNSPRSMLAW